LGADIIRSDFEPDKSTPLEKILLAAFFPGITRDIAGKNHRVDPNVYKDRKMLSQPGMGLYVLTDQVVKVFGGTVSLRTKNYFLNFRLPSVREQNENDIEYSVKLRRYGNHFPSFLGNLLTIRLPLR
jgi:hypothetical protein